jgi:MATE family multidrug resistance protein
VSAVLFLVFPVSIAGVFSSDAATVAMAATLLPIAGVFQIFDGVQAVAIGVLRGTGDTRIPMLLHLGGFWGIGIPLCLILAFPLGLGPRGIWWGYVASLAAVAVLQLLRVRWRFGRDIQRLQIDVE